MRCKVVLVHDNSYIVLRLTCDEVHTSTCMGVDGSANQDISGSSSSGINQQAEWWSLWPAGQLPPVTVCCTSYVMGKVVSLGSL